MNARRLISSALLLFVGVAVALVVSRSLRPTPPAPGPAAVAKVTDSPRSTQESETASPQPLDPVSTGEPSVGTPVASMADPPASPPAPSASPERPSASPERPSPSPGTADSPVTAAAPPPAAEHRVVRVAYFHATARCVTCVAIERQTHDTLEGAFTGPLAAGTLEWATVNVDEPENRHFTRDYQLYTKSVIVSELIDGREVRWKNLDQVWQLVRDPAAFSSYVAGEVRAFLGEV